MKKRILLAILILSLSGCVINFGTGISSDAGFFVSENRGEEWIQKVEFLTIGERRSFFSSSKPVFLKADPQDPKALFIGSMSNGLFYSFDKGNSWQKTLQNKGVIHDVAIDPQDKCVIYVAAGNTVYKTTDCMRHWQNIHIEGLPEQSVKAIAVDAYNNNKVYIGTSGGGLFKSLDYGVSWESINWFKSTIEKIMINPKDTAKVYVATSQKGIYKSNNEGLDWFSVSNNILYKNEDGKKVKYDGVDDYFDMEFDLTQDDALVYSNAYGLFYTNNGGEEWSYIKLLTKPKTVTIRAVAFNPNNGNNLYYATPTTLYKSVDKGREWTTEKLPTTKIPVDISVDVENGDSLFMIAREIK